MKTQTNQILTVVGFFTMSMVSILGVSWGVAGLAFDEVAKDDERSRVFHIQVHSEKPEGLDQALKLLIPKSLVKRNG